MICGNVTSRHSDKVIYEKCENMTSRERVTKNHARIGIFTRNRYGDKDLKYKQSTTSKTKTM